MNPLQRKIHNTSNTNNRCGRIKATTVVTNVKVAGQRTGTAGEVKRGLVICNVFIVIQRILYALLE